MRTTFIAVIVTVFLLGVAQPDGCGGECCDVPPTDAGSDAGKVDDASTDAGTVDATSPDSATDDSSVADAGDPCEPYLPLLDGQEWNCTGSGTFTCTWAAQREGNLCYLFCPDHFPLERVREGWLTYTTVTATQVVVCYESPCSSTWTCTSP